MGTGWGGFCSGSNSVMPPGLLVKDCDRDGRVSDEDSVKVGSGDTLLRRSPKSHDLNRLIRVVVLIDRPVHTRRSHLQSYLEYSWILFNDTSTVKSK